MHSIWRAFLFSSFLARFCEAQPVPDNPGARGVITRAPEQQELPLSISSRLPAPINYSLGDATPPALRENQVGFHRAVPGAAVAGGQWTTIPGGIRVWRVSIESPGAKSLRVHFNNFSLGRGKVLVFAPSDLAGESAQGPYTGAGPNNDGAFWSAIVPGERIAIEFQPDSTSTSVPFGIDLLSHGLIGISTAGVAAASLLPGLNQPQGAASKLPDLLRSAIEDREAAASCTLDVRCYGAYNDSSDAVAHMRFEDDGSYVCTGWLINTRSSSRIPYFITNNHCIGNQTVANTLSTYFRYRTASCNGPRPAVPARQSIGATYLVGRPVAVLDFAFLRLPSAPQDAYYLGWTTNKLAVNASITAIGHPQGDYMRIAFGTVTGGTATDKFNHRPTNSTSGMTQGGSSGSPWLSGPGTVAGLHARGNAANYSDPCRALLEGNISGGGEWFAAIYPFVSSYLEDTPACTVSVTPATSTSYSSVGGTGSLTVTTSAPSCPRNATSNSGFITITSGVTGNGSGTVNYSVAANSSTSSRTGTISIGNQAVTITQAGVTPTCTTSAIQAGTPVNSTLNSGACSSQRRPGSFARLYTFSGTAGQNISIDLTAAFDTYLYLLGPSGTLVASDDDGGGGTNSRIPRETGSFALPSTGTYTIEATSFSAAATGSFTLTLRLVGVCSVQPIASGQTLSGSLSSSDCFSPLGGNFYVDRYTFTGAAGQGVRILMESPTMDTWLTLIGPDGEIVSEDDDSAGNLNSVIPPSGFLTLTQSGTYTIETTTYDVYETGLYTVRLTTSGTPPATGSRFRAVTPCRVADTRPGEGKTGSFGPPIMSGGSTRTIPVPQSTCGIPSTAKAYSLNITVVPSGPLSYLTVWPAGGAQPLVSTLNSFEGLVVANAATVPAGTSGSINIFVTNNTHVIVDINGYYE